MKTRKKYYVLHTQPLERVSAIFDLLTVTPEEVMKWLREWGLMSDPALIRLKNTNPMAYKRILKYAVMFILKKQAKAVTKTR